MYNRKHEYMVICCYFNSEKRVTDFYDYKPQKLIEKLKTKAKTYDESTNRIVLWF